jgi:hypothetical protein
MVPAGVGKAPSEEKEKNKQNQKKSRMAFRRRLHFESTTAGLQPGRDRFKTNG